LIPIECPFCEDASNWHIVETPEHNRNRAVYSYIKEDTDEQINLDLIQAQCDSCSTLFYLTEEQAEEHIKTFL